MGKDPAFLFYSSDFLTGTMLMNNEEIGAYIKLLCLQHQQGHLEEKDILSISNNSDKVKSKFKRDSDLKYYNERLEEEVIKRKIHGEKQRENVMKRWNKYNNKKDTTVLPSYYQTDTKTIPLENENENVIINNNISKVYYSSNKELNKIFKEYLSIRVKLKLVNSERAIKTLLNKLENYDDNTKIKMIEQSIVNSWKSIYELKEEKEKLPDWFDKDIKEQKATLEEQKKIEEVMKKYKEEIK